MNNLAGMLQAQEDLARARPLQEQVLEASRRLLSAEHRDTTIGAWHLFVTLVLSDDAEAAGQIAATRLIWLLRHDPAHLAASQQPIRQWLTEFLGGKPEA